MPEAELVRETRWFTWAARLGLVALAGLAATLVASHAGWPAALRWLDAPAVVTFLAVALPLLALASGRVRLWYQARLWQRPWRHLVVTGRLLRVGVGLGVVAAACQVTTLALSWPVATSAGVSGVVAILTLIAVTLGAAFAARHWPELLAMARANRLHGAPPPEE